MTNAAASNAIRDIKPPVEIPSGWEWLWWTLGAIAVAGIIAWVIWWWRRRQMKPDAVPLVPAHVRARQKLEAALGLISQPKPFCIAVSDTVRFYLEERFNFHAPERTTEEFLHELSGTNLLLPDQKETLGDFLTRCDLVKFARYEPREAELRELHQSAIRLIDETQPMEEVQGDRNEQALKASAETEKVPRG
ncbi:MAG TPA: hypothetical protein VEH04_02750 [Verrucomicrobiae bacterium]|nr:hypothetical protein [Verrucomicrobiae bacterium]